MELSYPLAIIICSIVGIILFFINLNHKTKYTNGKKVANTQFIKETEYYKKKMTKYKILSNSIKVFCLICIILTSILIARPITVETRSEDKYNRDIFLSLDASTTESEVNIELINKFKKIIPEIKGDRIGIMIYNTAPVVYSPLTTDYDYINERLSALEEQFKITIENNLYPPNTYEQNGEQLPTIWNGGISLNSLERGSSLVGDGLSGTLFSFPDLKEDEKRTRIIIFATDNDVRGTETVTLADACALYKKYNVNLYAYCPTVEMNSYTSAEKIASYKKAVEENGNGKFYTGDLDKMSTNIANEIKETKSSLLKTSKKTYVVDHPEIFVKCIIISFIILIIIEKRVRL